MRISNSTFTGGFLNELNSLQNQQNKLQEEASSGLAVSSPEDNPSAMAQALTIQTSAAQTTQYQNNINQLQNQATVAGSAISSLQTLVSQVNDIATQASSGTTTPTQLSSYATQVEDLIQQAVQLANTQDADGNYLFSGTATSTKPFATTTDASGNVTGVTYQGNTSVAETPITQNMSVTAQVPGENTTGSGAAGLFADSRTGANLFSHMIALQSDLSSGNTSAISSTDVPALQKDDENVINNISANGVMQSALTAAGNLASAQSTNYAEEMSNDTSANLATVMTQLDQTQTAYQAALESGMMVMQTSLVSLMA